MRFYLGSYTRLGGPGVAVCELNGDAMRLLYTDALPNSTYVILNRAGTRLFAVCSDAVGSTPGGSVASYALDLPHPLPRLSQENAGAVGPCHLCLSADERFLYTANYHSGSISVFPVSETGAILPRIQLIQHEGSGPDPKRQAGPHAHQVTFLPFTNTLCCADLGLDALMLYDADPVTGLLTYSRRIPLTPASGPRHVCYGNGQTYVVHEMGGIVTVLDEALRPLQVLPTLPVGWRGESTAAAIRLTPDGNTLIASNRGHDSLAFYRRDCHGIWSLEAIRRTPYAIPRDFNVLPDGRLIIAHQEGAVVLAKVNGNALETISELDVKAAVCVTLGK